MTGQAAPAAPASHAEVGARARARRAGGRVRETLSDLASLRDQADDAVRGVPVLAAQVTRLHSDLASCRLHRANLAAAGKAAIASDLAGEPDPLGYVRDELEGQGYAIPGRPR